jgi:hypothetical protein
MKIFDLLRNPFVKITGVVLVLYFALFANTENPNSLGNRLSSDNVKQDLSEIKEKSKFIVTNVKVAQGIAKEREAQQKAEAKISFEDLESGEGEEKVSCGNIVEISYAIYNKSGKQLEFSESKKLTVGSKENLLVEQNIIDMKRGGIRNIIIPYGFKTDDKKLESMLTFNESDLKYQITLLNITKATAVNSKISCE